MNQLTLYHFQNIHIEFVSLETFYVESWNQQQIYKRFIRMQVGLRRWTFVIVQQPIDDIFFQFEPFSIDAIRTL